MKHFFWGLLCFVQCFANAQTITYSSGGISAAISKLSSGDTLLLPDGLYREKVYISNLYHDVNPITVKAINAGKAVITGSERLSTWSKSGSDIFYRTVLIEPSLVFVDNVRYQQIAGTVFDGYPVNTSSQYLELHKTSGGIWPNRVTFTSLAAMPDKSFYYNKSLKRLYIKSSTNILLSKVEVSTRDRTFFADNVSGLHLDGVSFQYANTSVTSRGGSVLIVGNNNVISNVESSNNDLVGIQIIGDNNVLVNSTASANGQLGVTARGKNNEISYVTAKYNNFRGFNKWWEAGGFKFVGNGGLHSSYFNHNTASYNYGDGIWYDYENSDNVISYNSSSYNEGFGIHYEVSSDCTISNNYIYGNLQVGIYLSDSSSCTINNNYVIKNDLSGILVASTGRKDSSGNAFYSGGILVFGNLIGWNLERQLQLPSNEVSITLNQSDNNTFFDSNKNDSFSVDYPSVISRPMSLSSWTEKYGYDSQSTFSTSSMPDSAVSGFLSKTFVINEDNSSIFYLK